jgi:iron-sulfur cluster repair protein YtfE (RIC family)
MQSLVIPPRALIREGFASEHCRLEHTVERVIQVLAGGDREAIAQLWNTFDSELTKHLETEEEHLFPLLMRRSERDAKALLEEHKLIRLRLAQLDTAVDLHTVRLGAVREFIDELQAHAAHEDALLYQLSDEFLSEPTRVSILESLSSRKPRRDHDHEQD